MKEPKELEAAEPDQTHGIKAVDLPRLVRRFEQIIEAFDEDIKIHWLYMNGGPLPGWHTDDDPPWEKEDSRNAINELLELRKDYMMMRDDPMGMLPIDDALDHLREMEPIEQVKIKCGNCKKSTRILKAEFWGKIFRCVHCSEVIADERNRREPNATVEAPAPEQQ